MRVCTDVGKRLHTLLSHPTVAKPQDFSRATLANFSRSNVGNTTKNIDTNVLFGVMYSSGLETVGAGVGVEAGSGTLR